MAQLLDSVMRGGPMAVLLLAMGAYAWARHRGWLLSGSEVDRSTSGHLQVIAHLEKELAYWRSASDRKDSTIQTQADQIARLMRNSDLSTHALTSLLEEARSGTG